MPVHVPRRWRFVLRAPTLLGAAGAFGVLAAIDGALAGAALGVLALALLLPLFEGLSDLVFPIRLHVGIALFSAAAILVGEWLDVYEALAGWDVLLHALSAAVLSVLGMGLAMMATGGARPHAALWVLAVLAFGFSMMVGAMWELMEFGLDQGFGLGTQKGAVDTMSDVAANAVGAVWGARAALLAAAHGRGPAPGNMMTEFMAANPVLFPLWTPPRQREARRPLARQDRPLERGR